MPSRLSSGISWSSSTTSKLILDERFHPAGYNVGFNAGAEAGQTIDHLHVHVIPRYRGDVPDPRGGIRNVIPTVGNYLQPLLAAEALARPPPALRCDHAGSAAEGSSCFAA